jgi:hypothetical protein
MNTGTTTSYPSTRRISSHFKGSEKVIVYVKNKIIKRIIIYYLMYNKVGTYTQSRINARMNFILVDKFNFIKLFL